MTQDEIFKIITQHVREVMPGLEDHEFEVDQALKDLGANSMDRSEIVMMSLESLQLNIPLVKLATVSNLGELARTLHEQI